MSMREESDFELPVNLPQCSCFATDRLFTMGRCAEVAGAGHQLCAAFHELTGRMELCPDALPFFLELMVLSLLTYVARSQGPALEYGSQEMEWETERLLHGMEARVLERSRDTSTGDRGTSG